jgi:hypothetical protein
LLRIREVQGLIFDLEAGYSDVLSRVYSLSLGKCWVIRIIKESLIGHVLYDCAQRLKNPQ